MNYDNPSITGYNTNQPIRERGWTHWHHLFNPRQMLKLGLSFCFSFNSNDVRKCLVILKNNDFYNKLCRWTDVGEKVNSGFSNQALNPNWNFGCKSELAHNELIYFFNSCICFNLSISDARQVKIPLDLTITDPPYADAVNYDELSEFFLAWLDPHIKKHFPDWYCDSKRDLAVRGKGDSFNNSMIECYSNLTKLMPDHGLQVIMFNSTNVDTWNDFSYILWKSGLKATAFWSIVTEPLSAINKGNRLKTTSIFVCKKRLEVSVIKDYDDILKKEMKNKLDELILHKKQQHIDMKSFCYSICVKILTEYNVEEDRKDFGKKIMDRSLEIFRKEYKNKLQNQTTIMLS